MSEATGGSSLARGFVLGLLLLAISGGQALAHRSPSNCNANRLTLSLDQNPAGNIVSGQTVTYTVGVFNPGPGTGIGCDVTGTTVTFTCPGPDGSPSGQTTVLGTGLSFPADNSGDTIFPSVSCTIVVTPGVTSATARAQAGQSTGDRTADLTKGILHDSAVDDPFVRINDLSVNVRTCAAKVDKQVSCDGGLTFHDVGLVTGDEDGHTDVCFGWNEVDGTLMNTGTGALQNCVVTDKVFPHDPTCPPTTTTSTDVTVTGVASLPAGQSTTVMGSVTGLTTNACNTVSVTCEIKDSVDPANPSQPKKTPPATDQDVCAAAPPKNCFTRTPGFWGTHPHITQRVLGTGLPSCGLVVNTTAAATPVSSTEDICSVGTDPG